MPCAIDLNDGRTVSVAELRSLSSASRMALRHRVGEARNEGRALFCCPSCGFPAFVARDLKKREIWKHYAGAPSVCPWYSGRNLSPDDIGALKYNGLQEGALHRWIKETVGDLLRNVPAIAPDSVVVDRYIVAEDGRRRPDIRARHGDRHIAFEIQLATTTLPEILNRNSFYRASGMNLAWLTWDYSGAPRSQMLTSFEDILHSHGNTLFSVDHETIRLSRERRSLLLRAFVQDGDGWAVQVVDLADLAWSATGLARVASPNDGWAADFRRRWKERAHDLPLNWQLTRSFFDEIADRMGNPGITAEDLAARSIDRFLSCCLSILDGSPIGSRHENVVGVVNSYLYSNAGKPNAAIIGEVLRLSSLPKAVKDRTTVQEKIRECLAVVQHGGNSLEAQLIKMIFGYDLAGIPGSALG